jgi:DNA-binding response OmpR family regulator
VLVVHDGGSDLSVLSETLRAEFIVREATTPFEALERLSGSPLACVVCVVGGTIRATDFYALAKKAAPDQVHRLVFVMPPDVTEADLAFLRVAGAHWLTTPHTPAEALAVVRAVSTAAPPA